MIAMCNRDHLHDSAGEAAACDRLPGIPVIPGPRPAAPWPDAEDTAYGIWASTETSSRPIIAGWIDDWTSIPVWVRVALLCWAVAFGLIMLTGTLADHYTAPADRAPASAPSTIPTPTWVTP